MSDSTWTNSRRGTRYSPNLGCIELDITWRCNLRCMNCDRSCRQAPTEERMEVGQIAYFVAECVRSRKRWQRIRILGGEPTLHPELFEILDLLLAYRTKHAPGTGIEIVSNGHGSRVRSVLGRLPLGIKINNTNKTAPEIRYFEPFNVAPTDLPECASATFSDGCWITAECGIGLNRYGYYPCAVAGGIARVFGLDVARTGLPSDAESMRPALDAACRYCGHFLRGEFVSKQERPRIQGEPTTASWTGAYASVASTAELRLYGDVDRESPADGPDVRIWGERSPERGSMRGER